MCLYQLTYFVRRTRCQGQYLQISRGLCCHIHHNKGVYGERRSTRRHFKALKGQSKLAVMNKPSAGLGLSAATSTFPVTSIICREGGHSAQREVLLPHGSGLQVCLCVNKLRCFFFFKSC